MTVFLDDSVAIAGCPKIIFIVNGAAVSDVGNGFPIAKAIHYIAVGIEFKVRGRLLRNFPFLVGHIIAINDEDVTLRVHGCEAPH